MIYLLKGILLHFLVMWKKTRGNFIPNDIGKPWVGRFHVPLLSNNLQSTRGRITTWSTTASCPCLHPMRSCHYFELIFLQWTFVQDNSSQLPPFFYERMPSFVLSTCLLFCHSLHVQNCNFSALPKYTHLLWNNFYCLIFKVNNSKIQLFHYLTFLFNGAI